MVFGLTIFSKVGEPMYGYAFSKNEWVKGEVVDGFTIPYNVLGTAKMLFDRFQLWQNSKGICVPGVNYTQFRERGSYQYRSRTRYYIMCRSPMYIGDTVYDVPILYCENTYHHDLKLYKCFVEFVEPGLTLPTPVILKEEPVLIYLKNLYTYQESVIESVCDSFDDYTTEIVLPSTVIVPGGAKVDGACPAGTVTGVTTTSVTSGQLSTPGSVESIKTKLRNRVEEAFKALKESTWH